jgi:CBS domain-containing membrane protein
MTRPTSSLRTWLGGFLPAPTTTRPREWLRASFGAALAILCSAEICRQLFGEAITLQLIGPLGASAILLFAVSSGALAQPWSIVGSYLTASLVAIVAVQVAGQTLYAASLAIGTSLLMMYLLRCLHPPGGAVALCVTLGSPASEHTFFALLPVLVNAACLLACALLYNNLTRVRYPKAPTVAADLHHTLDPDPQSRAGISSEDLQQALEDFGEFVDITREDLEEIMRGTQRHALRRSMGEIRVEQIMSRDLRCGTVTTTVDQALAMLKQHRLRNLPVLDEAGHLAGIISVVDLIGKSTGSSRFNLLGRLRRRRETLLGEVMSSPVITIDSNEHVVELIPLLSGQGLHCLPVLEQGRLVGMLTQTDLIAGLQQHLLRNLDFRFPLESDHSQPAVPGA